MTAPPAECDAMFVEHETPHPTALRVAGGQAVVYSTRSPEKSTDNTEAAPNEDGAYVASWGPRRGVLAVADGMGGQPGGALAAGMALRALRESVRYHVDHSAASHTTQNDAAPRDHNASQSADRSRGQANESAPTTGDGTDLRETILNGFEIANRAVMDLAIGAGTTLAVVEIDGPRVRGYHAGDSMILVVGQRGLIRHQTVSHSPVGYAVEAGVLAADEAMHHEERHIISNLVGTEQMRIEVGPALVLKQRDTLLLASDGLFDNLLVEEIVESIRKGPLERAARTLSDLCSQRMREPRDGLPSKPDDLTFILFRQCD